MHVHRSTRHRLLRTSALWRLGSPKFKHMGSSPPSPDPGPPSRPPSAVLPPEAGPSTGHPQARTLAGPGTLGLNTYRAENPLQLLRKRSASNITRPVTTLSSGYSCSPELSLPLPAHLSGPPLGSEPNTPEGSGTARPRTTRSPSLNTLKKVAKGSNISIPASRQDAVKEEEGLWAAWDKSLPSLFGLVPVPPETPVSGTPESGSPASPARTWSSLFAGTGPVQAAEQRHSAPSSSTASSPTNVFSQFSPTLEPPSTFFSNLWSTPARSFSVSSSPPKDTQVENEGATESGERVIQAKGKYTDNERKTFNKPKLPLVLAHGLFGFGVIGPEGVPSLQISYWRGVKEALEEVGVEVHVASVPMSASIEERARALAAFIEAKLPGREVNLIGHSMGGLDSRFLISNLKPTTFKVSSLTTIATPHRGSAFADYLLFDVIGRQHLPKLLAVTGAVGLPGKGAAFEELTLERMARFNDVTQDDPKVFYQSYGATFEPSYANVFRLPWGIIYAKEDLIGWVGRVRYWYADWVGKSIKFKPVSFFLELADTLGKEGY